MAGPDLARVRRDIVEEVAQRAKVSVDAVGDDVDLRLQLGLSSIDLLSVLAHVEQELGISFPDEELEHLTTMRRIDAKLKELVGGDGG